MLTTRVSLTIDDDLLFTYLNFPSEQVKDEDVALAVCCAAAILPHRGIITHRTFEWHLHRLAERLSITKLSVHAVFHLFCRMFFPYSFKLPRTIRYREGTGLEDAAIFSNWIGGTCHFFRSFVDYATFSEFIYDI